MTQSSAETATAQIHPGQLTPMSDATPGQVEVNCPTPEAVEISFATGVDASGISEHALQVLRGICSRACVPSVIISSGTRTAESQAHAMYQNVQSHGLASQRSLYGPEGNQVLDVYEQGQAQGQSPDQIQAGMAQRIRQLPGAFHHVSQGPQLSTFDVAPSSVHGQEAKRRFIREAQHDPNVVHFYQPPNDPGYHLEISNP